MDPRLPSEHLHLQTVRKVAQRKSLQSSSLFSIPRICSSWIQGGSRIHKEKARANRSARHTNFYRCKTANGRQIWAKCMLFRQGWAEILSIHGYRRGLPETFSLCVWGNQQLFHGRLFSNALSCFSSTFQRHCKRIAAGVYAFHPKTSRFIRWICFAIDTASGINW